MQGVNHMKKIFCCKDLGIQCAWESIADTEEELIRLVAHHAAEAHGMNELTGPMRDQIVKAIKDKY